MIGTDFVAKSPADGYTILFISTSITTNAASGKKLPYDPLEGLEPIGGVAHPDSPGPFDDIKQIRMASGRVNNFATSSRPHPILNPCAEGAII